MRIVASPALTALTRQSTRFSPGSISTVCVSESLIGLRQSPGSSSDTRTCFFSLR